MLLPKTDLEKKLHKAKSKRVQSEENLLNNVLEIFSQVDEDLDRIETNVSSSSKMLQNDFKLNELKLENIYHIDDIKNICIDYRLRFLDTKYFKGKLPVEALSKIKQLENLHQTEIKGFKIIAPSKLFKLEDKDDPLLFAPIGNGYFYLIHKWGNDLHPMRKLLMWPFKNIVNLAVLVLIISYVATLMIPNGLFSKSSTNAQFWIMYFFVFKCIAAVVIFYGFALGKNFNPAIWNSKYFNS
ncbi:hypothetical protein SAMN04488009_1785 [Maribacter sedimenticola]|uniref:Uncharacterized protein n=1 Tax=Maribacter sedimenticola TaxID=228956 RepID=A0ABY1SGW3_9FLAO|nr:hypothetical protein [Maribacter sedimenticola]SNR44546.1 hypothetical protein SAMN04488009_1785 [Maribacter sedimenticola]